jgi:hypothetical protein
MALSDVDDAAGNRWALAQPSGLDRFRAYLAYLLSIRFAIRGPTFGGILWGFLRLLIYAGLASAPFWIDFFDKREVPQSRLFLYSGIMLILLILNDGYANYVKHSAKHDRLDAHKEAEALAHRHLINEMEKLIGPPAFNLQDAAFMSVLNRTLDVILYTAKEELDALDATYLEATLLLFEPHDQIAVAARAVGDRATGMRVDRRKSMAYHVAKARVDWRQVPDLTKEQVFAAEGISTASCPYRSILIIPVVGRDGASCRGVVTLDSSRPYEFWNKTLTDRLYKRLMPFIRLLAIACEGNPEKV